jgi:uracil-DNA glycosylase
VCADQGIIAEANPTFSGVRGARFFIVGQAPGPAERESRQPFTGRAGKELDRWMVRAGFRDAEEFRRLTYIAALMRCFPGRNKKNTGDLPPPRKAIANCAHWLDEELRLLKPKVLIPIGQLAITRFLGTGALEDRVGRRYGEKPVIIPLPHPSGQSRWLNAPVNRVLLAKALALIAEQRSIFAP